MDRQRDFVFSLSGVNPLVDYNDENYGDQDCDQEAELEIRNSQMCRINLKIEGYHGRCCCSTLHL